MSKEKLFKELISSMAKDGEVSPSEYELLIEKGNDLGFDRETIDLLIKMELEEPSTDSYQNESDSGVDEDETEESGRFTFKSSFVRGGGILTPDVIIIDDDTVTYRKRNKYLINVDTVTVSISKISSVELNTSLLGTDIIIKTFGAGEIVGENFTKSDAKEIRRLIQERQ